MRSPKQLRRVVNTSIHLARSGAGSIGPAWQHRDAFRELTAYCTFIGYPRSGHTLVGSLLDAHPDVVIAHELDALRLVRWRIPRRALYGLLVRRSEEFAASGSQWMGYSYAVPGAWQGRYERLRVLGDKRGATSSTRIGGRPQLIRHLRQTVRLPLRFIRVTRNPYDNIARMYLVARERGRTLEEIIRNYALLTQHSEVARSLVPASEWIDIRSESMIADPRGTLTRLCKFLSVDPLDGYLDAASAVVFASPNLTRERVEWTRATIEGVEAVIGATPHLAGYTFD